jgi:hypothetical protein
MARKKELGILKYEKGSLEPPHGSDEVCGTKTTRCPSLRQNSDFAKNAKSAPAAVRPLGGAATLKAPAPPEDHQFVRISRMGMGDPDEDTPEPLLPPPAPGAAPQGVAFRMTTSMACTLKVSAWVTNTWR